VERILPSFGVVRFTICIEATLAALGQVLPLRVRKIKPFTPWLTGTGARNAEDTDMCHEDAEGIANVGARFEPAVRLVSGGIEFLLHCRQKFG
jgi:hypothetical protein